MLHTSLLFFSYFLKLSHMVSHCCHRGWEMYSLVGQPVSFWNLKFLLLKVNNGYGRWYTVWQQLLSLFFRLVDKELFVVLLLWGIRKRWKVPSFYCGWWGLHTYQCFKANDPGLNEEWIPRAVDFKALSAGACVTVLPRELFSVNFSVNLDTSYEYSPVPLEDQAQIPGGTWNVDHLATL